MGYANLDKLATVDAGREPFPHLLCGDFIGASGLADIHRDFPEVPDAGSFPLASLKCGEAFSELVSEIRGPRMAEIISDKLDVSVRDRPTMVTVRGFCRPTDGKIHIDSGGKMVTALLYLNRDWAGDGSSGQLRLLRGKDDIGDYFMETPPGEGVLIAFRCDDNAWHGHLPFSGERRAIQLNWVVDSSYVRREATRHFISAAAKKIRSALLPRRSRQKASGS